MCHPIRFVIEAVFSRKNMRKGIYKYDKKEYTIIQIIVFYIFIS